MSLDNIQLQPISIRELYGKTLVEIITAEKPEKSQAEPAFNILGKNQGHVIIIVNNADVAFVPDEELNFLLGVLSACKLNMDDVGILNLIKYPSADYKTIATGLNAGKVFLFGVDPAAIKLPLSFPHYQVQQYNGQTYLSSPALIDIQHDKTEKTKLWNCLRQIFSI